MIDDQQALFSQDEALNESEIRQVIRNARERFRVWKNRFLFSLVALFLSCGAVYPFLYGHWLHSYWESFGKCLLFLCLGVFTLSVYSAATAWMAWTWLRDLENGKDPSMRYR
jgi:hypothetical protein